MRSALGFEADNAIVEQLLVDPDTNYEFGGPLSAAESKVMDERIAAESASTPLIEYVEKNSGRFGGVHFEHPNGGELLVLATTTETTPEDIDAVDALLPADLAMSVVAVSSSLADLRAAQEQIQTQPGVSGTWVDVVTNELVVDAIPDILDRVAPALQVKTRSEAMTLQPVACASRASCTPYRAGINVDFPHELCTWGWIARTNLVSQLNLISAGHCATLNQSAKHNGVTVAPGVNRNSFDLLGNQQVDVLRAPLSASSNLTPPYNLLYLSDTNKSWAMTALEGASTQVVGETACYDGRADGNVCGTINATGISGTVTRFDGTNKFYFNLIRINRSAAGGDSGAPVRIGATALGLVDFADVSHGNNAVYGGIDKVQQSMNVQICITSDCNV